MDGTQCLLSEGKNQRPSPVFVRFSSFPLLILVKAQLRTAAPSSVALPQGYLGASAHQPVEARQSRAWRSVPLPGLGHAPEAIYRRALVFPVGPVAHPYPSLDSRDDPTTPRNQSNPRTVSVGNILVAHHRTADGSRTSVMDARILRGNVICMLLKSASQELRVHWRSYLRVGELICQLSGDQNPEGTNFQQAGDIRRFSVNRCSLAS